MLAPFRTCTIIIFCAGDNILLNDRFEIINKTRRNNLSVKFATVEPRCYNIDKKTYHKQLWLQNERLDSKL